MVTYVICDIFVYMKMLGDNFKEAQKIESLRYLPSKY